MKQGREIILGRKDKKICAAIFQEGQLCEYKEEDSNYIKLGNIYRAKVTKVMHELNAAFAEIENRATVYVENAPKNLKAGNMLVLSIKRLPFDGKYHMATTDIVITGKYSVVGYGLNGINISKKITDQKKKIELKEIAESVLGASFEEGFGVILRTAAGDISHEMLEREIVHLAYVLKNIIGRGLCDGPPELLYRECDFLEHIIRDNNFQRIVAEGIELYEETEAVVKEINPNYKGSISLHRGEYSIFDVYDVNSEVKRLLQRKIWLKSGAYMVVDKTEALTAIDINSGKYDNKVGFETMAYNINAEAAKEIAKLLCVRNIGGIIIVDFLKMRDANSKEQLIKGLKEALKIDRAGTVVAGMTNLGLIEIIRKRI